jgi:hypothetical protein
MNLKAWILSIAVLLAFVYLVARPHLVTVWRVVGADGSFIENAPSQATCENDALTHNQRPADVNTYGKSACRDTVEFQWGSQTAAW